MSKTKRQKISVKRDIDLKAAADFISKGVDALAEGDSPNAHVPRSVEKEKKKKRRHKFPWEDEPEDMAVLTPIPTVSLPREYALKLDYIMRNIGFTKQFVCRSAIIERIDQILREFKKSSL